MTWHELAVASTVRTDVAAYRALETTVGMTRHLPVNIDEYAARYQLTSPGQMVAWLSALEAEKVDGDLAYWNINGSLGDSVAQQNIPNAQWWLYNWYSSMPGHTVAVTAPQGNTDDTLQGLATLDPAARQARIILGGGAAGPEGVTVKNIDPALFGHTVHATVLQDRWSGMTGAAAEPARTFDKDVPVGTDGSITLPVTQGDQGDGAGGNARHVMAPGPGSRARSAPRCPCAATTNTSACRPASCLASATSRSRPGSIPRPTPPGRGCSTSVPEPATTCS